MAEYQQFLRERERIDFFIQNGYQIKRIAETFNGDMVEFEKKEPPQNKRETLDVLTPKGRKYYAVMLLRQNCS